MKLLSTEETDHTADILLDNGTVWHATGINEDTLRSLTEEIAPRSATPAEYL